MNIIYDDDIAADVEVPYFEEAKADFAPHYTAGKHGITELAAQSKVSIEFEKLGAYVSRFMRCQYADGDKPRYGYEIRFSYSNRPGILRVSGLPIKHKATDKKILSVRVQALMNVRDWLKGSITQQVFAPHSNPLLLHLLLPDGDGQMTVADYIINLNNLPMLDAGKIIIEKG